MNSDRLVKGLLVCLSTAALWFAPSVARPEPSGYPDRPFSFSIGPAIESTPTYPGSSATRSYFLPDIEAEYGRFFISGTDFLGFRAVNTPETKAGVVFEYDYTERLKKDSAKLESLGDVSTTPRLKLFVEHNIVLFLLAGLDVATDIGGHHEGTIAHAHLDLEMPLTSRGFFTIGPGVTWSDSRWMSAFYGVSDEQAHISGLAPYNARAGVSDAYIEAVAGYTLSTRWSIGLDVTTARLLGDVQHSQFTESLWQTTVLASILYKLR